MSDFTVLMLTDDSLFYQKLGWLLECKGCLVLRAGIDETRMQALPVREFDLVLAQVRRAAGEDLGVLKQIKSLHPRIRTVLCSGDQENAFPLEAYELEADDYLFMPCRPAEIWRRVAACLQRSGKIRSPGAKYRFIPLNRTILENSRRVFDYFRYNLESSAATLRTVVNTRGDGPGKKNLAKMICEVSARLEVLQEMTDGLCRRISGMALINALVQGDCMPAFPLEAKQAPVPLDYYPRRHSRPL